jgi:hypothetical protein
MTWSNQSRSGVIPERNGARRPRSSPQPSTPGLITRLDPRACADNRIRAGYRITDAWCLQGQNNTRVPLDVTELDRPPEMTAHQLVAVHAGPDHRHLRAYVGVDRAQVNERTGLDQLAERLRQGTHARQANRSGEASTWDSRIQGATSPWHQTRGRWRPVRWCN